MDYDLFDDMVDKEAENQWRIQCQEDELFLEGIGLAGYESTYESIKKLEDFCMYVGTFEMVSSERVTGNYEDSEMFYGEPVEVDHVYVDIPYNSYSDSFSGNVYIPTEHNTYVKCYVCG